MTWPLYEVPPTSSTKPGKMILIYGCVRSGLEGWCSHAVESKYWDSA
ncbi:hypothetical protein [Heliorestis convoluta]|uniref:Uncharacterized protein n=1 Tax=Heliorestis convoluta TaxID=356322 RepID=A0A5Q2MWV5_9FIRM|nr:hypothetical protein [Heliorestis convoluta]QGG46201.1 hypothetical protein FTV88_0022 [Heliorestis convoluta]